MSTLALIGLAVFGVALLLVLVMVVRLQAFVALLVASMVVALIGGVPPAEIAGAIQDGMGSTLGYIAIVIGVGAMFGEILQVSGGAERIAETLLDRFSDRRSPWALALTGLIVSSPVFFDVALILFIPLVYGLVRRTGRSLLFYGIPLTAGMAVAHSFIPPTPGPVAVAALLGADLGWVIFFGVIVGAPVTVVCGILWGRFISARMHVDVPDYMKLDEAEERSQRVHPMPSFGEVLALILLPLVLILMGTGGSILLEEGTAARNWLAFLGHPFTALILAALLAFYILGIRKGYSRDAVMQIATKGLEPVGLIILVTGAGGVFGKVLIATGIGEALAQTMAASNLPLVLLAFGIAAVVRVSQGSATVSMVTAAGLISPVIEAGDFSAPYVAVIVIAVASGASVLSHVNDSGFWLVSRYFGISEKDTLRSWTVMMTILGLTGVTLALIISAFL